MSRFCDATLTLHCIETHDWCHACSKVHCTTTVLLANSRCASLPWMQPPQGWYDCLGPSNERRTPKWFAGDRRHLRMEATIRADSLRQQLRKLLHTTQAHIRALSPPTARLKLRRLGVLSNASAYS